MRRAAQRFRGSVPSRGGAASSLARKPYEAYLDMRVPHLLIGPLATIDRTLGPQESATGRLATQCRHWCLSGRGPQSRGQRTLAEAMGYVGCPPGFLSPELSRPLGPWWGTDNCLGLPGARGRVPMPNPHGLSGLIRRGDWCGSELSVTFAERTDDASGTD